MVYTITLNPALDRTLWVEKIQPDDSNRIEREERYDSGKGIDVSKILTTLEVCNNALGFIGDFAAKNQKLKNCKILQSLCFLQNYVAKTLCCHSERSEESRAFLNSPRIADYKLRLLLFYF